FRRIAYLKRFREDLLAKPIRGNVDTRIRKVQERKYDGVILAEAGLQRLGLTNYITQRFSLNEFLPAAGQGILAVTARKDNEKTLQVLRNINDEKTFTEAVAERAFIRTIGGGCKVPIGANTTLKRNNLILEGEILSLNGKQSLKARISGSLNEAEFIGEKLAYQLLNSGGETLIKKVVKEIENLGPKSP
ncbi:MAG: hydroxymethylbilane synthase, partial [Candidatus Wukongarchaeota archaeon]|nr:hydroxymethylbilane synthase [Candidatus Wukongarchaeota archaeon]